MKLLADFHAAILENNAAKIASALKPHPRLSPEQQFAIYADGYRIRLLQAIRSDYPELIAYLGENIFDKLASGYIEKNPPTSYNLDFYPHKFASFISQNSSDVFVMELAILESAIAEVFMLPDSDALAADALTKLSPEELGETRLNLRTASHLLKFSTNANEWLTAERSGNSIEPKTTENFLLIYRHNNEVHRLPLSQAAYLLLAELLQGNTLNQALESIAAQSPELLQTIAENLQIWFAEWVGNGVFRG